MSEIQATLVAVRQSWAVNMAAFVAACAVFSWAVWYVIRYWSYIPRRKQRSHFNERF